MGASREREGELGVRQGMNRAARAGITRAVAHLEALEGSLVDRAIEIAKTNGYAPYTTTIRAAWTEAVRSVTEALGRFLFEAQPGPGGPLADVDYRSDPLFARMRGIARMHRTVGITLELYVGLFKHFRRIYLDALVGLDLPPGVREHTVGLALDFFDCAELSITADWTAGDDDHRLRELQARARSQSLVKDRYVAIFESLRNPAFVFDKDHRLIHANKAAIDLFIGEGEAGDSLYRHGHAALTARLERSLRDAIDMDMETASAVWVETMSGRHCYDVRRLPLHDAVGNTSLGHLLQLYDVTAHRHATEHAQCAERQMSRFLATMSHEIRTPLHSVLGAAELLRTSDGAVCERYLDVVQSAGQSLLLTLNNVLDYSKLEHGQCTPRPSDTDMRPALEAVCAMATVGLGTQRPSVSLDVAPGLPERMRIDWAMTRQVITNLLSNAIRYDDGTGVRLSVTRGAGDPATCCIRFTVCDHGPGLPAEAVQALSRPFDQIHARHTTTGGAGLGLAISRYLVGAMAGQIGYCNTETGAHVWFEVPVKFVADNGRSAVLERRDGPIAGRGLLVDDDPVGALVTEHQLARIGLTVDRAATLQEARATLARNAYDAVVVDYFLPDGTGPDLLPSLCVTRRRPSARVIALTANAEVLKTSEELCSDFDCVLAVARQFIESVRRHPDLRGVALA
jgi:two-component system, OmpR family, aerobic respiration control sensor histidine kinase ArcB